MPDKGWLFNGDVNSPTFTPSFRHNGMQTVKIQGEWTGEWVRDAAGNPIPETCHYNLTAGVLQFHGDCTHALRGQNVPLPPIPANLSDAALGES